MAATFRFVPGTPDRLKALFWPDSSIQQARAWTTRDLLRDRRGWGYVVLCFLIFPVGLIAYFLGTSGDTAVMGHLGGALFGYFGFGRLDRQRPDLLAAGPLRSKETVGQESLPMKVLRGFALLLFAIGLLTGVFGYYVQVLL
jgi:membrane associated rhomboid family serine protease